jgi:transcriptional regulator with XRE-family HTH domain
MLGLSQEEVCAQAGCARKTLTDFENDIRLPSQEKILDIRRALELSGAQFFVSDNGIAVGVRSGRASSRTARAKAFKQE